MNRLLTTWSASFKPAVKLVVLAVGSVLTLGFPAVTQAGRACETKPLTTQALTSGMALAQRTQQALDEENTRNGTRVVVLARAGQDLSKYQLRHSHLGWAYKTTEGSWHVLHKLNQCGTATASIYRQGLGEFFMDDLWLHEAAWSVPAPAIQGPLLALLTDPVRSIQLHTHAYNMVSYAWATRYQQSNQWALETMAMAVEPGVTTREQAQAWLVLKGYQPSTLHLNALTRLGASTTQAHIQFDDHPTHKRFSDRIETVTVDSVFEWLTRTGLGSTANRLAL
jgi:hypothetical protein